MYWKSGLDFQAYELDFLVFLWATGPLGDQWPADLLLEKPYFVIVITVLSGWKVFDPNRNVIYNICNDCLGIAVCNKAVSFAKMSATL